MGLITGRTSRYRRAIFPPTVGIIISAARRGLGQNRALAQSINRFLRDVEVGVIRQGDRRSDADDTAQ